VAEGLPLSEGELRLLASFADALHAIQSAAPKKNRGKKKKSKNKA
jgi:hypothetical protein